MYYMYLTTYPGFGNTKLTVISESLGPVLKVVAATTCTSFVVDFKHCFNRDSLQTRCNVFPSVCLLPEI